MENKHIELTDAEVEIVNQITEAQRQLQNQINTALAVSFASRSIKNAQITSMDGNKLYYTFAGEEKSAELADSPRVQDRDLDEDLDS